VDDWHQAAHYGADNATTDEIAASWRTETSLGAPKRVTRTRRQFG
jgi:hypothetical protein